MMHKPHKLTLSLLALSSALLLSGAALAEDKKPEQPAAKAAPADAKAQLAAPPAAAKVEFTIPDPVAVVNGKPITKAEFDQHAELYTQQSGGQFKVGSVEANKWLRDQLVMEELLVQEADKQKLADDPQNQQRLEMLKRQVLIRAVLDKVKSQNVPSEEAIKKEYETAIAAMKANQAKEPNKEYKASHILVDSEDKAKEIIAELTKGGNFAELAKTKSSDSSSAKGGDLDWFTLSTVVPPFAQAVAKMEKGKYSEQPVKTDFGWHVILLEDVRDATPPPLPSLEELKPRIVAFLESQTERNYLNKLKADAKIEVKEIQIKDAKAEVKDAAKDAAKDSKEEEKKEEKK